MLLKAYFRQVKFLHQNSSANTKFKVTCNIIRVSEEIKELIPTELNILEIQDVCAIWLKCN